MDDTIKTIAIYNIKDDNILENIFISIFKAIIVFLDPKLVKFKYWNEGNAKHVFFFCRTIKNLKNWPKNY